MRPFYLISACLGKDSRKDSIAMSVLDQELEIRGLPSEATVGFYKGTLEVSRCVKSHFSLLSHHHARSQVLELARLFNQESFLEVGVSGYVYLHYSSGISEYIGKWTRVDSAEGLEGYTIFSDGSIFTVRPI